jgi:hypothetical protein
MPDTPNTPARLSVTYRRLRRLTDVSMGGVTALALASVAALVVCINGDLYFHDSYHHFDPVSRDIDLFTGGGAVGLAFALSGLRLRLFKTLACVVALCFFVVVFEALLIYQLKETGDTSRLNSRPIVPWLTILLAVFGIRGASSEGEIAPNGRTRHSCGHLRRADTFSGMGVGVRPRRPSADSNTLCLSPPRSDVAGNQAYHCDRGLFYLRQRPGGARDSECPASRGPTHHFCILHH